MTNQLLLAQVLAEGNDATQTFTALPWTGWIPAAIGLLSSIIVAWWSGRKIDKQIELSKQATPPELIRYKTLLEISGKYKELVNFENVDALSIASEEYREIEALRKEALTHAIWERKVLASCPNIRGQKRLLNIPASQVVHGDKKISSLPNFRYGIYLWVEALIILPAIIGMLITMVMLVASYSIHFLSGNGDMFGVTVSFIFVVLVYLYASIYGINLVESTRMSVSGERFAEYGYLRILQEDLPSDRFRILFKSSLNKINNSQRLFFALWDENYRNFVYCPKWVEYKFAPILGLIIFGAPYWLINIRNKSRGYNYGEYRPEIFGISEEKSGYKDEQSLSSDIPEESQPTHPQG